ncbi:MAG: lysophospholipase L1-like esterase [Planctomycetota bacterium]|jgi:lysophospholipase L1-like esterase
MARLLKKVTLTLVSTVVCVGMAEFAMATWLPQAGAPENSNLGSWGNKVHQPSKVPGLLYELRPGARSKYRPPRQKGLVIPVKINSFGMHGPQIELEKGEYRRIAVLGDSTTFGYGVETSETYPAVLQAMLTDRDQPNKYQTLNFGVAGYSTREEAIVLEHKALKFKPDAIIVGYNLNDPDGEHAKQPLHNHFVVAKWWRYSHLVRFASETLRKQRLSKLGGGNPLKYWHAPGRANWAIVEDGFARIATIAEEEGLPVLVVIFTAGPPTKDPSTYDLKDLHAQVALEARKNGFDVLDLSPAYSKLAKEGKKSQLPHSHPNVLGQLTASDEIAKFMLGPGGPFAQVSK